MVLKVLGSGSSGNCYIIEDDEEALIIECGLPFIQAKIGLGFNVRKLKGVIISHEHSDHAEYARQYEKAGIKVFKPFETGETSIKYGDFKIQAFPLVHDVPCFGFVIDNKKFGRLVYASDTEYIKYKINGINHFMIESNYFEEAEVDDVLANHIYRGHMSLSTALGFIDANKNENVKNVILCHLSATNADPVVFKEKASEFLNSNVFIAGKGLEVKLND